MTPAPKMKTAIPTGISIARLLRPVRAQKRNTNVQIPKMVIIVFLIRFI